MLNLHFLKKRHHIAYKNLLFVKVNNNKKKRDKRLYFLIMWDHKFLTKLDFRQIILIFVLMIISLLVVSSMTANNSDQFFTLYVKNQIQWFSLF